MASTKNVIFIGMTQNGKSSLIQQILRYAGEHEKARAVGIGQGNFSETQTCSLYTIEVPLKTHRLRQISNPAEDEEEEEMGNFVIPGEDFELEDADDLNLVEAVQDSGDRLRLTLIDTPGLSDSANNIASTSGMRVIDERHKLRILLTLQEVEDVHAICFVVRRDTNYGGDFQRLVKRMVELLTFSVRSTAWNLNYHVIHTNIDVDDRTSDICEVRQRHFDEFGPAGSVHHFIDNEPDREIPLDVYFTNQALSNLFRSLAAGSSVKFSNLHYPKSPEHECNDQEILNAIRRAIGKIKVEIEDFQENIESLERDIEGYDSLAADVRKRMDEYDEKLEILECDTLTVIGDEEGWTEKNFGGGGQRVFSFNTSIPIAESQKSHDGDGDWKGEIQGTFSYHVTLHPHWLHRAHGWVKVLAKKRDKYSDKIKSLKSMKEPVSERWQAYMDKAMVARIQVIKLENQVDSKTENIVELLGALDTIHESGHSISLAANQKLVKYFTMDSPLAAALGYQLQAKVPWTVPPLNTLSRAGLKIGMSSLLAAAKTEVENYTDLYENFTDLLGAAHGTKVILDQLAQTPLGVAKVQSSVILLKNLESKFNYMDDVRESPGMKGLSDLILQLEIDSSGFLPGDYQEYEMETLKEIASMCESNDEFLATLSKSIVGVFKKLQKAIWEEKATQLAAEYLSSDEGLPVGVFASLIRAVGRDNASPYLAVLSELKDVGELGEMALDK